MKPQNTILEELKEIAPNFEVVDLVMPYSLPKGYFEQLADTILERKDIALEIGNQTNHFQIPDQYFNGLADKILLRVKEMEDEEFLLNSENAEIAPILNTIPKVMPFAVPHQYFEKFSVIIPSEKATVIPMKKMRNWMTYAAAAVFVGIMVTGSFLFSDKKTSQDFEKYQNLDVASALDQVSDSDLNAYIDENHATVIYDVLDTEPVNLDNVEDKIQSMSTDNLNQYLNENGFLELKSGGLNEK